MRSLELALAMLALGAPTLTSAADTPAALAAAEKARSIARTDLTQPLFLCEPGGGGVVRAALNTQSTQWQPPTRAFDNLYYIGNGFVGVWILRTSAGLILFDATQSEAEARDYLVPGMRSLGLEPQAIRYVIVTHGHYDHFGGAAWLQRTYGARIGLSEADWELVERTPPDAAERNHAELPRRDLVIADGQALTLGDSTVTFYVTPGHTPGTVSATVPVREGGRAITLSLLGSTAFPPSIVPTERWGGLDAYDRSVGRFAKISAAASAVGLLNTHIFADGTRQRLDAVRDRPQGATNPFLIRQEAVARYYAILHHCLLAAKARPQDANVWNR